jgi:hypothetical protein
MLVCESAAKPKASGLPRLLHASLTRVRLHEITDFAAFAAPITTRRDPLRLVASSTAGGGMEPHSRILTYLGRETRRRCVMGRYLLLWLLGIPIPILILIWAFGGLT